MTDQLNYEYFFYGLGFMLLAAVCFTLYKSKQHPTPRKWPGRFGLLHGLTRWLDTVQRQFTKQPYVSVFAAAALAILVVPWFFVQHTPIVITLLAVVLLTALYIAYERQRESVERISSGADALAERMRLSAFSADISASLAQADDMQAMLHECAEVIVNHLGVAFARIWTLNEQEHALELQASAGVYTHIHGSYGRVPITHCNLSRIVLERKPHLTNAVAGNPYVADQEWAKRENMVAFAGYPLLVNGRVVGIMAVFARRELSQDTIATMETVAHAIAVGIQRKQTEEALRKTTDELESFFSISLDLLCIANADGHLLKLNAAWETALGYSLDELLGDRFFNYVHPDDQQATSNAMSRLSQGDDIFEFTNRYRRKDGTYRWIEWHTIPAANGLVYAAARDVTKHVEMEAALAAERNRLATTLSSIGDGVIAVDMDSNITLLNPVAQALTGWESDAALGVQFGEVFNAVDESSRERADCPVETVLRTGVPIELVGNTILISRDGIEHSISNSCAPIRDNDGTMAGVVLVFRDVTERKLAEERIREQSKLMQTILDGIPDIIGVQRPDHTIISYNKAGYEFLGTDESTARGKRCYELIGRTEPCENCQTAQAIATKQICTVERYIADRNTWLESRAVPVLGDAGEVTLIVEQQRNITSRKRDESQIRLHSAAINAANDLIAILDRSGRVVFVNDAFQQQNGYSSDEIVGLELPVLWTQLRDRCSGRSAWAAIRSGSAWSGEMPCRAKDGSSYTADVTITPLTDEEEQSGHVIVIARNITERKEYEELLDYQAHHDALTDLPNRLLFSEELESLLSDNRSKDKQCAILFIDLDKFKLVNDTMGHQAGDQLLVETAARLGSCLREGDTLARMGGDEFTALLRNLNSPEDAGMVAERMLERMSMPFEVSGARMVIGASIGIGSYPDNAGDVTGLLTSADAAMYRAKELGRNNFQFFSEEISETNQARVKTERDLRLAIERNELEIYYQPIIDVNTMQITSAEALLRWNHPEKGIVSPGLFIPVAEETGLILQMGKTAIETACKQCKRMQDMGHTDFRMSVNVSPAQLGNIEFISEVYEAIAENGLSPQSLDLEVTETILAQSDDDEVDILSILKALGVRICLDDFGIGHSSLGRLKNLPIVHMKIDGLFIRNIEHSEKDRAMTESIIVMAHNLGIQVTAEWIEDEEQLATIRAMNCDYAQGYLISPALPAQVFEDFVEQWAHQRQVADAA